MSMAVKLQNLENSLYLLKIFRRNYKKMCSIIEFSFAFIVQKVSEKLLCTVFSVVADFFKFSGYFGRKGLKQSGNCDCRMKSQKPL
jgi:hypothetical protein